MPADLSALPPRSANIRRASGGNQMAGGLNVWIDDDIMSAPLPGSIMIFLET